MTLLPSILIGLYLLLLVVAGWWLVVGGRPSLMKAGAIVILACSLPAVMILPALARPDRGFADLAKALGLLLLAGGGASFLLGAGAGWLWRRRG